MAAPPDDGVSPFFWLDDILHNRETGQPVLGEDGLPIEWVEPEPDPSEFLPYDGPTIWAAVAYRLDLPPETAVTIWIERETEHEALSLFFGTAGAGMGLLHLSRWEPANLAQHLRWLSGHEGNLAAVISRNTL